MTCGRTPVSLTIWTSRYPARTEFRSIRSSLRSSAIGVQLDVALGGRQVRVTGERLDVPQRPADGRDLSSCIGHNVHALIATDLREAA